MAQGRATLMIFMVLLISACNAKTAEGAVSEAEINSNPPVKQDAPAVAYDQEKKSVAETPTPSSVLYFIYDKDGDGASSYEVENGSWATYWYGYRFDFGGKQYFTGFAYQTQDKYGKSDEENFPDPDAKATITQATYVVTHPGTDKPWTFEGAQRFVGELGAYERANEIDETRKSQDYHTRGGLLLHAIPTWYLSSGTRVSSYDLFLFNPKELLKIEDERWTYVGNIVTGEDNSAACDEQDGGKIPCAKSSGELTFVAEEGTELPLIKIMMSGTDIASASKVRTLGKEDVAEYRYNADKEQYQ